MSGATSIVDISNALMDALSSDKCPVDFSEDEKQCIVDLCEENAFSENQNTFEREILKIVNEAIDRKILEGE